MCICILKTKDGKITEERLKQASIANSDGWGLLFNIDDFLIYKKNNTNIDEFDKYYNSVCGNIIIHFRTASSSGFGKEYCHPFFANKNLAFVHNGNLFHFSSAFKDTNRKDKKIDTIRFNEQILQKLPENFLDNEEIFNTLNTYCKDQMSKMIFMNNQGKIWIINEEHGEWKDGCWYSNRGMNNYAGYGYSGAYEYNKGDIRHKGGLSTIQMFSEKQKKEWFRCNCCNGWYKIKNEYNVYDSNEVCNSCVLYYNLKEYCK